MVSEDTTGPLAHMLSTVLTFPLIKRGAESEIRLGYYLGLKVIFKIRKRKSYMHPKLDIYLRKMRTKREAQTLIRALEIGAKVPRVIAIYPSLGLLILEYIEGMTLKEYLNKIGLNIELVKEAGRILALVHKAKIIHGDPTTSNYIVSRKGLYLLDFGLADLGQDVESRAVDLHLFRRALESTHSGLALRAFDIFKEGYLEVLGYEADKIIKRAEEIRLRGRYVESRRKSVWKDVGEN